jgi:tetratricopeptide (TPR) repeat protein
VRLARPSKFVLLALALGLAGCGSAPKEKNTAALQAAALEANRKGDNYVRHNELENAARSYREAMRLSQSLEDADGIAANAINLSVVRQRQGRFGDARSALREVLEHSNLRFSSNRLAEASLRHALVDFDERRYSSAAEWTKRAGEYCEKGGGPRCPIAGALHNTRSQLALQEGRLDAAVAAARAGLEASRSEGERAERANALRLLGVAALRTSDGAAARTHFEQALAIDRDLGAPRKIALDLLGLGRAATLGGDRDGARAFYGRALAVSEADRDSAGIAEARAALASVEAASGK